MNIFMAGSRGKLRKLGSTWYLYLVTSSGGESEWVEEIVQESRE
jgi:hypothetical protein